MARRKWFIYTLADPITLAVRYVGKSYNPAQRFKGHLHNAGKSRSHCARWVNRLISKGLEPSLAIIDAGFGDGWASAERAWIAEFKERGARLTNIAEGGEGWTGGSRSEETREKLRAAALGKKHSPETIEKRAAAMRGRKLAPEHKAKISRANRGKKRSPEVCLMIGDIKRGTKHSEETRRKMSQAHLGHHVSDETREKIAASKRGKPRSEECKAKVAATLRGRKLSEEHRAKCRAAQRARRERERQMREESQP